MVTIARRMEVGIAGLACSGFVYVELNYYKIELVARGVSLVPTNAVRNRCDSSIGGSRLHSSFTRMERPVFVFGSANGNQSGRAEQKQQAELRFNLHEADNVSDHRVRMIILQVEKRTRKPDFVCIALLFAVFLVG